ncbi:hypothetical protein HYH02_007635 [Chlamydomonas schloesseri]|uniref:Protein kinase domain-containing protein n=1 Tax=Chlamydomonas schloesseri TaxID=2026947 RepID=A0A836B4E1_9CHLO|nr:hypothetical protein HYH02_007635 [Chlamydomonas schloesseri]|eukprot:KAG2447305.1 hypothetical protein HYH02_007635 [Chlamydomonas schloesseri]
MSSSRSTQNLTEIERTGPPMARGAVEQSRPSGAQSPGSSAPAQGIDIPVKTVSSSPIPASSAGPAPVFACRRATVYDAGGSPHSVAAGPGSGSTPNSLSTASDGAMTAIGSPALMVPTALAGLPVLKAGGPLCAGSSGGTSAYTSPRVQEGYGQEVLAACMAASSPVPEAPASCSEPVMPPAPAPAAQPCAPPPAAQPSAAAPQSKLLAVSPALPSAMSRPVWSLDDYSISRRLYKGSSSAVYKATCIHSGMAVALKVYFLNKVPVNVVHMLKREIEIHSQLVHKHVARLHGAFLDDSQRVVLVQEFAARGDLLHVMQRLGGRMPPEHVAELVMRPFLEAISYLHSRGICHRDIKPENVLFTTDWRLLVADFGVSINLHQERAVTRAGTEGYMAPEVERCPLKAEPQENKDKPQLAYSTAVDIWAVGCMAYELMVGFPPAIARQHDAQAAAASNVGGFVASHMTAAALHFPASVPQPARNFVTAALLPDPAERPTAAQLLQHLWLLQAAAAQVTRRAAVAAAAEVQASSPIPMPVPLAMSPVAPQMVAV